MGSTTNFNIPLSIGSSDDYNMDDPELDNQDLEDDDKKQVVDLNTKDDPGRELASSYLKGLLEKDPNGDTDSTGVNTLSQSTNSSINYVDQLNEYLESGLIDLTEDDIQEELEAEEFGFEQFMSSVRKGLEIKKQRSIEEKENAIVEAFKKELGGLSEITRKGIEFERYNQDDTSVADFYKTLVYKSDITNLNPESDRDAEKILREWNKIQGLTSDESEETILNFKEAGKLLRQASIVKPKLDLKASEISKQKLEEQRIIDDQQEELKSNLEEKVRGILNTGKVGNIPIDQNLATWLYRSVVQDEIPVKIKGKVVNLTGAEALVMYHKYDEKGSVERLMQSLIFLTDPEKFDSTYVKEVKLKETEKYVSDHKISAQKKVGRDVGSEPKNKYGLKLRD